MEVSESLCFSSISYLSGAWRDFRLAFWGGPNDSLGAFGGGAWPLWPPPGSASGQRCREQGSCVDPPFCLRLVYVCSTFRLRYVECELGLMLSWDVDGIPGIFQKWSCDFGEK